MKTIGHILFVVLRAIVQAVIRFDRKFWKRYFNVETPLYKAWWGQYAAMMQRKLDKERKQVRVNNMVWCA